MDWQDHKRVCESWKKRKEERQRRREEQKEQQERIERQIEEWDAALEQEMPSELLQELSNIGIKIEGCQGSQEDAEEEMEIID